MRQFRPVLGKVLTLIRWTTMMLVLSLPILPTLAFIALSLFPIFSWASILLTDNFSPGDMKVPTCYSLKINGGETVSVSTVALTDRYRYYIRSEYTVQDGSLFFPP